MRIKSIVYYHTSTSAKMLLMVGGITLAIMIITLATMAPYISDTVHVSEINVAGTQVVSTTVKPNQLMLGSSFDSPQGVYITCAFVLASIMATTERKYLLAHPISRYELTIGNFLSMGVLTAALSAMQYVIDVICRAATWMLNIQVAGSTWTMKSLFFGSNAADGWLNCLGGLIYNMGLMMYIAGGITLAIILFTRWKKTCIALCVAAVVIPVLMVSFLPANWMSWLLDNMAQVIRGLDAFLTKYSWLFMYNIPSWQACLQLIAGSVIMYGFSYLVLRRMPVWGK